MRKIALFFLALCVLFSLSIAVNYDRDFLATAEDVGTSTTAVTGTDFDSREISIPDVISMIGITVTFTRTTGSAEEVDFKFQYSYDEGNTWTTAAAETITFATNIDAVTNVARAYSVIVCPGVTHVRLYEIDNRDTTIAPTACNATLSYKR